MTTQGEFRDWRPGDGLTCRYARQAPMEIPCGRPVRTAVQIRETVGRKSGTIVSPVCENHADFGMPAPYDVMVAAKRAAQQALTVAHWDEYQKLLRVEIDEHMAAAREAVGLDAAHERTQT